VSGGLRPRVFRHLVWIAALLVFVVFATGLGLWVQAKSGSKAAELGTSLLSGLVVGLVVGGALYVAQAAMSRDADRRQDQMAMSASTEPIPSPDVLPAGLTPLQPSEESEEPPVHGHFRVTYEGTVRDTSRLDALQVRLRVFADDTYFQFVTVPVPAPELRGYVGADANVTQGQIWGAIARIACPLIEDAVRRGEIPLADRTHGFEVYIDVGKAIHMARYGDVEEIAADQTVCEFQV
jgi:hypothetical protein